MGTSVKMIDDTYGHLAHDADDHDRDALEAFDQQASSSGGHVVGTSEGNLESDDRDRPWPISLSAA